MKNFSNGHKGNQKMTVCSLQKLSFVFVFLLFGLVVFVLPMNGPPLGRVGVGHKENLGRVPGQFVGMVAKKRECFGLVSFGESSVVSGEKPKHSSSTTKKSVQAF